VELAVEAREVLRLLADLRWRRRRVLALKVAGYRYAEVLKIHSVTYTKVRANRRRGSTQLARPSPAWKMLYVEAWSVRTNLAWASLHLGDWDAGAAAARQAANRLASSATADEPLRWRSPRRLRPPRIRTSGNSLRRAAERTRANPVDGADALLPRHRPEPLCWARGPVHEAVAAQRRESLGGTASRPVVLGGGRHLGAR
jgi:hypothetical protein